MGTRCGGIDPSVVTFLMNKEGLTADEMSDLMNKKSGFLGVSGVSSDCRDLNAAAGERQPAELSWLWICWSTRSRSSSAAMLLLWAAWMPSSFTGGIGENDG